MPSELPFYLQADGCVTSSLRTPERNLLAAVLARAICDAFGSSFADSGTIRSAKRWLASEEIHDFSFFWVCQNLELDPVQIKIALKESAEKITGRLKSV